MSKKSKLKEKKRRKKAYKKLLNSMDYYSMNDLSKEIIDDGQLIRATNNYLKDTYDHIKGKKIGMFPEKYDNYLVFLAKVMAAVDISIRMHHEHCLDEPEMASF